MRDEGRGGKRGRVKRRNVEAGDGWTVVTHGIGEMALGGSDTEKQRQAGKEKDRGNDGMAAPRIVEGLTAEKLMAEFRGLQKRWEGTGLAAQVKELVGKKDGWKAEGKVENAVCVGIGSFSRDWAHRWRSLWQLVLFVDVVACLDASSLSDAEKRDDVETEYPKTATTALNGNGNGAEEKRNQPLTLHAQDPAFTPLDMTFLSLLHITTTPTNIETHITPTTFLYSPFVDWFLLLPTFLSAPAHDPALYVGNEVLADYSVYAQTAEKREKLNECNALGQKFLHGREVVRLVEGEGHGSALGGMVVLWKKEDEEDGQTVEV